MSMFGWNSASCSWLYGCNYNDYYYLLDDLSRDYYNSYVHAYKTGDLAAWEDAYRATFGERYYDTLHEMNNSYPGFTFSIHLF